MLGTSKTPYKALYSLQYYVRESDFWTPTNPSERKAISECFAHPAALAGSVKKRSMANLAEFTVNPFKLFGNREETSERLTIQAICCYTKLSEFYAKICERWVSFVVAAWEGQINQAKVKFHLFLC